MIRRNYFKTAWYQRLGNLISDWVANILYALLSAIGVIVGAITVVIGILVTVVTVLAPLLIPMLVVAALLKFLFW